MFDPYAENQEQRQQQQYSETPSAGGYQSPMAMANPSPMTTSMAHPLQQQDPFASTSLQQQSSPAPAKNDPSNLFLGMSPPPARAVDHPLAAHHSPAPPANYDNSFGVQTTPANNSFGIQTNSWNTPSSNSMGTSSSPPPQYPQEQQQQQPQAGNSLASPPPVNGMFLGMQEESKQDFSFNYDDDRELRKAREAALYAEDMLQKQEKQQQFIEERGPLGFGLLPKAKNLFATKGDEPYTAPANPASVNQDINRTTDGPKSTPWYRRQTPQKEESDAPWYSTAHKNQNEADYGLNNHQPEGDGEEGEQSQGTSRSAAVIGASVIGGVAGLVAVGPLVAIAVAGGAAYGAGAKDGPLAKVMRGAGGVVAQAGGAAKRFEDKTGVVKTTASGVGKGLGWFAKKVTENS